jgi:S-adenosylmethionine/arginine decarboxylase-like enzyme
MSYPNININGNLYYGKHSIYDIKKCKREKVQSIDNWRKFIDELVPAIDMIKHGDLIIDRFGDPKEDIGISGCQLILTSSITFHTNDIHSDAYIDIFSCKDYNDEIVKQIIDKYFEPISINCQIILRK